MNKSDLWEKMSSSLTSIKNVDVSDITEKTQSVDDVLNEQQSVYNDFEKEDLIKRILLLEFRVEYLQRELDLLNIKKT